MDVDLILKEIDFKAVKSGGPGGQHANKTSSKIILSFNIEESDALSEAEKKRILKKLPTRISKDGMFQMQCEESRSQHTNKELVTENFLELIKKAIIKPKSRKKTKPTKASKMRRLKKKRQKAEKKQLRKDPLK